MRARHYGRPLLLGVALLSSGCGAAVGVGGACSPTRISVAMARSEQPKQLVRVAGHYLRKSGVTRICDSVTVSASPRCAGSSLVVRRYEPPPRVKVEHAGGVAWTSRTVQIYGLISGGTLRPAGCA